MADFSAIKALINANIYPNDQQAITGETLNETLQGMVDAVNELKMDNIPIATSIPQDGMLPNVFYDLGNVSSNMVMSMSDEVTDTFSVWMFRFHYVSGTITWDAKIDSWLDGYIPTLESGLDYEVSVVNGKAVIASFE